MKSPALEREKEQAAIHSVEFIQDNMVVGLGTGSTSSYMIQKLGDKVRDGLSIKGVASSEKSAELAKSVGISLISMEDAGTLDINIDGADEFDNQFRLIKGGGGALLREKILAYNSKFNIVIADSKKQVAKLGEFKLPVEIIPFATKNILSDLEKKGLNPKLRIYNNTPFTTDENNYIMDIDILGIGDIENLNSYLLGIPGLVETGLFLSTTNMIIMGKGAQTLVFRKNEA